MSWKKSKIIKTTAVPFLGSLILLIVLSIALLHMFFRTSTAHIYEKGADKVLTASMQLENYLDKARSIFRVTADTVDYMLANDASTDDILLWMTQETENQKEQLDENYTGMYGYIQQTYLDGTGWVPPEGFTPTTREWYHAAKLARGSVTIATPYLDAQTGSMVVSICRRLNDGESVLAVDLLTNHIQSVVEETGIDHCGYGFVISSDGTLISHRDRSLIGESVFSRSYGTGLMQHLSTVKNGSFEMTIEGEASILFVNDVIDGWIFVLVAPKNELFADMNARQYFIAGLFLIVCLLITLLYMLAGRKGEHGHEEDGEALTTEAQDISILPEQPSETDIETLYDTVSEIRLQEARKYLGSDELLKKTLQSFYDQIPENADEIEKLSKDKDYENYTIKVHALKSSARLIGATELSELARVLEEYGNIILDNKQ